MIIHHKRIDCYYSQELWGRKMPIWRKTKQFAFKYKEPYLCVEFQLEFDFGNCVLCELVFFITSPVSKRV